MLSQIISLAVDVGFGALAYRLTTQLQAIVTGLTAMVKNHEERITKLENK